jgi:hypothetical protein
VIEHHQQLVFVGVQPLKQAVKGDEARAPLEDAIEARPHFTASTPRRREPVGLQVGIEPPDQPADSRMPFNSPIAAPHPVPQASIPD